MNRSMYISHTHISWSDQRTHKINGTTIFSSGFCQASSIRNAHSEYHNENEILFNCLLSFSLSPSLSLPIHRMGERLTAYVVHLHKMLRMNEGNKREKNEKKAEECIRKILQHVQKKWNEPPHGTLHILFSIQQMKQLSARYKYTSGFECQAHKHLVYKIQHCSRSSSSSISSNTKNMTGIVNDLKQNREQAFDI